MPVEVSCTVSAHVRWSARGDKEQGASMLGCASEVDEQPSGMQSVIAIPHRWELISVIGPIEDVPLTCS